MSKLRLSDRNVQATNVQATGMSELWCWYYTPYLGREEAKTVWSGVNVELIFWLIRHQSRISKQLL